LPIEESWIKWCQRGWPPNGPSCAALEQGVPENATFRTAEHPVSPRPFSRKPAPVTPGVEASPVPRQPQA